MKQALIYGGICILIYILTGLAIGKSISRTETRMRLNVGKQVIYGKDTVIVIDYSILLDTYTLSNQQQINSLLLPQLKQVK